MRIRIVELMGVTGFVGVVALALKHCTPFADMAFTSLALLCIFASVVLAVGGRTPSRAHWTAFAVVSCLYAAYAHLPDEDGIAPRHYGPEVTTQLLRFAHNVTHGGDLDTIFAQIANPPGPFPSDVDAPSEVAFSNDGLSLIIGGGQTIVSTGTTTSFMRIGHFAFALLFGWIAGRVAQTLAQRRPSALTPTAIIADED